MTHIKDDALDLALEALEKSIAITMANINLRNKAITAIKQARALDKMAENARELGLDYEPAKYSDIVSDGGMDPRNQFDAPPPAQPAPVQPAHISPKQLLALAQEANLGLDKVIEVFQMAAPAAQPAPVQPVASLKEVDVLMMAETHGIDLNTKGLYGFYIDCISNQPAAAIPDAITDNSESPEYRTGWNDCRAEMLKGMKP
jgi:hypothetical protein